MVDPYCAAELAVITRAFGKATAARLANPDSARIPELLSARLLQRLDNLAVDPSVILDLGTPCTHRAAELLSRYPKATRLQGYWCDNQVQLLSKPPNTAPGAGLRALVKKTFSSRQPVKSFSADPCELPITSEEVDLVLASQVLPWCREPGKLFKEVHRVLKPAGAFFWSAAGPDTLQEYRQCWSGIDHYPHVFGLHDMHDLGDDMLRNGFDAPVMDRENLTIEYAGLAQLVSDLRAAGAVNLADGRRRGLMAASVPDRLARSVSGELSVTLELVQGHGWRGSDSSGKPAKGGVPGEVKIPISELTRKTR